MDGYNPSMMFTFQQPGLDIFPTQYHDFSSTPFIPETTSYTQAIQTQTAPVKEGEAILLPSGTTSLGNSYICFSIPQIFFSDWIETEQLTRGFQFNLVSQNIFPPTKRTSVTRASIIENGIYRCVKCSSKSSKTENGNSSKSCPCALFYRRYLNHPDIISICYIKNHNHTTLAFEPYDSPDLIVDKVVDRAMQQILSSGNTKLLAKRVTPFLDAVFKKLPASYSHNHSFTPNHKAVSAKSYSLRSTDMIPSDVKYIRGPAANDVIGTRDLLLLKSVQSGLAYYYETLNHLTNSTKAWWASSLTVANATDNDISFIPEHPIVHYIQPLLKAVNDSKSLLFSENDQLDVHPSLAERSIHTYINPQSSMLANLPDIDHPDFTEAFTLYLALIRASFPTLLGETVMNEISSIGTQIHNDVYSMTQEKLNDQIGPLNFEPFYKM